MPRTILIVDDIRTNREILKNILGDEYAILEAVHGEEAVAIMQRDYKLISAVLLDLSMPVMDGFAVLSYMQSSKTLSQLPVIVTTGQTDSDSEERALQLGAKDYISKPYKSAIIRQRIRNTISLRETAATVNALQRDRLTGLFSRSAFFEKAAEMVAAHEPGYYVMSCFDIDNFKVINDQYGTDAGDTVLKYVASCVREYVGAIGGVCCRVTADRFAILYPREYMDSDGIEENHRLATSPPSLSRPISIRIGRYIVTDLSLTPSAMYDRATLAEDSVKGKYGQYVALYDESMREYLLNEQRIVNEMSAALQQGQFCIWFQPQYNHSTGALIGAEALVRWQHPEKGLLAPGMFIPIFEKNGFIYELDKFVWEETCRHLRKWIDEGRSPLPVSVNISRHDIFRPELIGVLTELVERYRIPVEMLRLEITESAFTESAQQIVTIVRALVDHGFTVEIDDFGSGYSSLNTLKSVPAQVVKLDMRFLEDDGGSQRGGNILESIVRMTKWLGMSVIAEGVEEKSQADFLKSIGCSYVQGFLYARPMPAAEYEAHCKNVGKEERLLAIETVENLDNNAFWNPKSMDTLIFNSYVGAACIFEHFQGKIELLRANDRFAALFGDGTLTTEDTLKLDWISCLTPESLSLVRDVLRRSSETGDEIQADYTFRNIPGGPSATYLTATMRVIASVGERRLVYCMCENITAQRQAEQSERKLVKQLQSIMDSVNCGITAVTVHDGKVEFLLANNRYYEILGYTQQQHQDEIGSDGFATVFAEDRARVVEITRRCIETGVPVTMEFRAVRRDGSFVWINVSTSMTEFEGVDDRVQLSVYTDVTAEKQAAQELLDNLPTGAALYNYDGERLTASHLNRRYWELVDREPPVNNRGIPVADAVHPEDRSAMIVELTTAIRQERDISCDIRILHGREGYRPFHIVGRILPKADGKYAIYATFAPITEEAISIQEMLPVALSAMMDAQTDFSFVKDRHLRYICCSHDLYESAGLSSMSEIVGKTDFDILDRATAELYAEGDRRVLATGESLLNLINECPIAENRERVTTTSKFPLKDSQGNVIGIYGVGRDITETRAMEGQLALLTNSIPGGIAIYEGNPETMGDIRLTYFSDGFCRLFGYAREEYMPLADKNPMGLVFPEDLPVMRSQISALVRSGAPMDCIYRAKTRDGVYKWINVKAVMGEPHAGNATVNAVLFDVTLRQEALERLRVSEQESRLAIAHSNNVVCRYDVATHALSISPSVNSIFELSGTLADVPYEQVRNGSISADTADAYTVFYESILHGEDNCEVLFQRRSTAGWRWIEAHSSTIFAGNGKPASAVISFVDVTDRLEKEAVYKRWQQSIQNKDPKSYNLFRCSVRPDSVFDTAEGALLAIQFTPGAFQFDEHTAQYANDFVLPEDRERFIAFLNVDALLVSYYHGNRTLALEYREMLPEEGFRWLRLTVDLVEAARSNDVEAYLLFEDIDAEKRAELLTIARAQTDPLTGVLNRVVFADKVDQLIRAAKPHTQNALLMLDIDGFKLVNDAFGHSAGDQALVEIANSLRGALRHDDLVGRLGGDEFAVFLADIPKNAVAATKAQQICALTRKSFSPEVEISGSVGIAVTPRDGMTFDELYKKADAALYYVKGSGKDSYTFYHEDMAGEHLEMEKEDVDSRTVRPDQKRRMLIVDDSEVDHTMLSGVFADDFIIEKAKSGSSALIRLRHYGSAISVVLLDLMMPGMDGFAVLEKMRQSAELRNIPVIVVSGDETRETSLRAIRAGATDFVMKPVDIAILRIRVQSAVSKAENERLRMKNSFLEYQNSEVTRYRTVLEHCGISVIEHDWLSGAFLYEPSLSLHIAGTYDDRKLWHILLADLVADTSTVKEMQELVHDIAADRKKLEDSIVVQLKTPDAKRHWFRMTVFKSVNEFGLTDKLYLTFVDLGSERPA